MNTPMYLKLFFPSPSTDGELEKKYTQAIEKHNLKAASSHPDAGFDLFCPFTEDISPGCRIWIDMQVFLLPISSLTRSNIHINTLR